MSGDIACVVANSDDVREAGSLLPTIDDVLRGPEGLVDSSPASVWRI
jgi:hypothetical protein